MCNMKPQNIFIFELKKIKAISTNEWNCFTSNTCKEAKEHGPIITFKKQFLLKNISCCKKILIFKKHTLKKKQPM